MNSLWLAAIVAGVITFALRLSFIMGLERIQMPAVLRQALRFVPIAVLTALIVPELLIQRDGTLALSLQNTRLLAGLLATAVAWTTRNVLLTIGAGMAGLLLLEALL
ncbi:MAG TPA: AzlD domain-containing protein [Ardenticatenaceae bacterium]|jgi:branched-subunit amino acid transport protein